MSEHHHHRSFRGFRCVAANDNNGPDSSPDAAVVIGLALAHARKAEARGSTIPEAVMARLDDLANRDDPACRMVRNWIRGRAATGEAEIISATTSLEMR